MIGLQHRVRRLPPPRLDEFDVVWRGRSWVSLAPTEARLFAALLRHPRAVVNRHALASAGWPDRTNAERNVDLYIKRLRRRISPLGLTICTVRQRGYFLEIESSTSGST